VKSAHYRPKEVTSGFGNWRVDEAGKVFWIQYKGQCKMMGKEYEGGRLGKHKVRVGIIFGARRDSGRNSARRKEDHEVISNQAIFIGRQRELHPNP